MHNKIYQVGITPFFDKEDYITPYSFEDTGFVGEVADYLDTSDREDDIKWLEDMLDNNNFIEFKVDKDGKYFIVDEYFKQQYFENKFSTFHAMATKLITYDIDDFVNDTEIGMFMYRLKQAYNDVYSSYFFFEDELMTMDTFFRQVEPDKKYYIGGTVDFHH